MKMGIEGTNNDEKYPFFSQNLVIQPLCERLTFKINQDSHLKANFEEIHYNLFSDKILLIAD